MIGIFASALAAAFSGAMMPGPLLTYTVKQSLAVGPAAGFTIISGHALLEIALIILIFLGFDIILQSQPAQVAIGLLGGVLLIYMGVDMVVRAARRQVAVTVTGGAADSQNMVVSGFLISAANPYFLLWWAVIGLGFLLQAHRAFGTAGVVVFFIGHILADAIWYGFVSVVVGTTRRFIREQPYRLIIAFLGMVLIYFGFTFAVGAAGLIF